MKKSFGLLFACVCIIFGLNVFTSAQTGTKGINKRQKNQQKRIYTGVKNGSVTGREYKKLEKQQIKTQKAKKRAKSDGEVTGKERFKLHKRLNHNSRTIYRAKHNKRVQKP